MKRFFLSRHIDDPKTTVSKRAQIDEDTVVMGHVIINTSSTVDHDCIIQDFAHISPNATLSGGVTIGRGTHVGSGAVIIPNITIGAGAVIIRDVVDNATVVGNPGRIIRFGERGVFR